MRATGFGYAHSGDRFLGRIARIYSVAFSPDGARLATATRDQTARVWDVASGNAVSVPLRHNAAVRSAAFSLDGRKVVTASFDRTARVWDAATGQSGTPFLRHEDPLRSAVFSFDGTRVLTASDDESARVWDAAGGLAITPPLRHNGAVWCAAFSPDGRRVVSGGKDNVARIWEIEPDTRPAAELQALAELLASERVDSADGLEYLTNEQWESNSRMLHQSMLQQFRPAPATQPVPTTERIETRPGAVTSFISTVAGVCGSARSVKKWFRNSSAVPWASVLACPWDRLQIRESTGKRVRLPMALIQQVPVPEIAS